MISLVHRTIFVHVPKCAGQSIELAFLKDIAPEASFDRHRHLLSCFERTAEWSEVFPDRLAHLKAHQYLDLDFVPRSVWGSFYKFAIVRDPVDRCVSMWRFLKVEDDFESFVAEILPQNLAEAHHWFAPQHSYTHAPQDGRQLVDDIIPLHELDARWPDLCKRTGLKLAQLPRRNVSKKPAPLFVSDEAVTTIRRLYADDYLHLAQYFGR